MLLFQHYLMLTSHIAPNWTIWHPTPLTASLWFDVLKHSFSIISFSWVSGLERSTDKDEKTVSPPSPLGRKPSFCQDPDNLPSNDKGDADADADQSRGRTEEKVPECDCSDSEKANEPDPAGVLDCTEDTQSDVEPATAPAQPGLETTIQARFSLTGEKKLTHRLTQKKLTVKKKAVILDLWGFFSLCLAISYLNLAMTANVKCWMWQNTWELHYSFQLFKSNSDTSSAAPKILWTS